jgi:hypothetical protein
MIFYDVDAALAEVPVNVAPLTDDTDFKSTEEAVAYNASGMDLEWHFISSAGAYTVTAVTPTTSGTYDWAHQGNGMYTIEIPASGGASINNDTEGYGYFVGKITGVLPFRGPTVGFRASGLNDLLCDSAYSTTRGLSGTALPNAAADAPGGLPISDAGGLDLDAKLANTNEVTAARMGALTDWINGGRLDLIIDDILADTADIQPKIGTPAVSVSADLAAVKAQTAAIETDTGTTLPAQITSEINDVQSDIAALNDLSAAQVNAEADTALADIDLDTLMDPVGEPSGPFAWASATIKDILGWCGALARNKMTSDASEVTLRNDADNADLATFAHSDDSTTFTSGEAT